MTTHLPGERVNFWTHWIGFLVWIPATALLVAVSLGVLALSPSFWPTAWTWSLAGARWDLVAISLVYGGGVMFLFFCSATYHRNKTRENEESVWRTMDHFAIFVMIAASYTPIIWVWFSGPWLWATLAFQWGVTLAGLFFKLFVRRAPRWVDPVLYLAMGWVAVVDLVPLYQNMPFTVFFDMFWGGAWFSVGALIYAFKWPKLKPGVFGFHELFHLFILGGAATHFSMVLRSVIHALS